MNTAVKYLNLILKNLPEDQKKEVIDFAEYLQYRQIEKKGLTSEIGEGLKQVKAKKYRPARDILNDS